MAQVNFRLDDATKEEDPFYHPANIAYLERAVADYNNGKKNFHVHELIDPYAPSANLSRSKGISQDGGAFA